MANKKKPQDVSDAVREFSTGLNPILDFLEVLVGGAEDDAPTIVDVYGNTHALPKSLAMYHEIRGTLALRNLYEDLPATVSKDVARIRKKSGDLAALAHTLEQAVMDDKLRRLIQAVFDGFFGDTPTDGAPAPGLMSEIHQACTVAALDAGQPAPMRNVVFLLRTGQAIEALVPFSRTILEDARKLQETAERAAGPKVEEAAAA